MCDQNEVVPAPAPVRDKCERAAVLAVRELQNAGFKAYLAGGCVRDLLRGATPRDYDICTAASPDAVMKVFPQSSAVGKSFGVVQVRFAGSQFEVATFREDSEYRDGRHPVSVAFADDRADALRRDFTINAMFYDPVAFEIRDYVGGTADIGAGVIRAVGEPSRRFAEDHLRMLRAVRFQAALGFRLDPATRAAILSHAPQVARISAERIRDEFLRILTESRKAGDAVALLEELGLLGAFLPEVCAMKGQEQPGDLHPEGDVFAHTVQVLNGMAESPQPRLALSALLHDVGKPATASVIDGRTRFHYHADRGAEIAGTVLRRLRLPEDDVAAVCHMVKNHSRWTHAMDMRVSTLRRLSGSPTFELELELHRLDRLASTGDLSVYEFVKDFRRRLGEEPPLPAPLLAGNDIKAAGVPEGPMVGVWKQRAYDLQLEGRVTTKEGLAAWLKEEMARNPGGG